MAVHRVAAAGMGLVVVMQLIFFATGIERGVPYLVFQVAAAAGSALVVWGLWTIAEEHGPLAIGAGFGVNAFARIGQLLAALSYLPRWLNVVLFLALLYAAIHAVAWSLRPHRGARARAAHIRVALWVLGAAHFYAATLALRNGRLSALAALALGAAGYLLMAPNVEAPSRAAPPAPAPP